MYLPRSQGDELWHVTERFGDPLTLLPFGDHFQFGLHDLRQTSQRLAEVPFRSETKLMMVKATKPGESTEVWYCKGALEMLLPRCSSYSVHGRPEPLTPSRIDKIKAESYEMGRRGLRVLALARGREQENLELVGMVSTARGDGRLWC